MSIYGTYRVKKLQVEDKCMTLAEFDDLPDTPFGMAFKAMAQQAAGMVLVLSEGVAKMGVYVPEEQREMAIAEGEAVDENGYIFQQETALIEENGAYFVDDDGDKMPLELTDDGYLVWPGGLYYGKA